MYRLSTKQDRLDAQAAQFESLLRNGYKQEVYKGLNIFINDLTMKIFKDTSSNHILFVKYRTLERMNEVKENVKANYDSRNTYKAEQKAKGHVSSHAACAAAIKAELTGLYPGIKFSVKSSSFSMGDSVNVNWTDGPTSKEVDEIIKKYQYGHFDGMQDIYENSNSRDDIPQSKYVSSSRTQSDTLKSLLPQLEIFLEDYTSTDWHNSTEQIFWRLCNKTSFPATYTDAKIIKTDCKCGSMEDFYKIVFNAPEAEQQKEISPIEVKAGTVQIIDYSEKAIAVIGDTKPIKDKLKTLRGSFNPRLSCGPGWVFPKSRLEEVKNAISQPDTLKDEVRKTIEALAEIDKNNTGKVSDSVIEAAKVQKVILPPEHEIYDNLKDITEAAEGGKVISLFNLCQLVNQ